MKYNADDPSFVIMVKIGPQPILFKLAQSMWKTAETQADLLWITSLEKGNMLSLIDSFAAIDAILNQKDSRGIIIIE